MENKKPRFLNVSGYTPEQYKKYTKYAWIVLMAFSILYCCLYTGRLNLSYMMPAMIEEGGWSAMQLGVLSSVLFWTYGLGHLVNGRLGEIFGVTKFITIGIILSGIANLLIGFQGSLVVIAILWGINGYFQSMLWSPGMALLSNWWPSNRRGFATGLANAFSELGQAFAAVLCTIAVIVMPAQGWRSGFIIPIFFMVPVGIIFFFVCKEKPAKVGLPEYIDPDAKVEKQNEELKKLVEEHGKLYPYLHLLKQWRFDCWLVIIACASIARYGLITWVPTYFVNEFNVDLKGGAMGTILLPLGMAAGTFIIPIISDKFFSSNRLPMVIICAGVSAVTVFVFMGIGPGIGASVLLFIAGFFVYAINGLVWAFATDVGGRAFAGTAAGVLDCCAYLGASIQALFFGSVLSSSNNWTLVFGCIVGVCVLIIVMSIIGSIGRKK